VGSEERLCSSTALKKSVNGGGLLKKTGKGRRRCRGDKGAGKGGIKNVGIGRTQTRSSPLGTHGSTL